MYGNEGLIRVKAAVKNESNIIIEEDTFNRTPKNKLLKSNGSNFTFYNTPEHDDSNNSHQHEINNKHQQHEVKFENGIKQPCCSVNRGKCSIF